MATIKSHTDLPQSEVLSNGQIDLLFTMLVAEATNTDPFEMEEELKNKGLVKCPSTI